MVLLTFREGTTAAQKQSVLDGLAALPAQIPEIRSYRIGLDAGLSEGNADLAIVADFDDAQAYGVYAGHPAHLALIAEQIRPLLTARYAVQYELPE